MSEGADTHPTPSGSSPPSPATVAGRVPRTNSAVAQRLPREIDAGYQRIGVSGIAATELQPTPESSVTTTSIPSARKIVLVAGASSGVGEATARHLAAAGHHAVLGARRADRLALLTKGLSAAGHSAEYAELDVTHPTGVHASTEGALACHRRIDVLVNNAGVMPLAPLAALRVAE